jgi:hypothetical protein
MSDEIFAGYPNRVDFALLVALAEGGEPPAVPEYVFGGRREFFGSDVPWYAQPEPEPENNED